jgi:hypothetical protein
LDQNKYNTIQYNTKLLDKRKQSKLQLLQDPSVIDGDNLNNVRYEANRHFRKKKREYLKDKIIELAMNGKNKNKIRDLYRGINEFKRGYQLRNSLVKYKNGDLLADSNSISNRLKNYFFQLLNVHILSDVRQIELHTAEPLVYVPGRREVEIAIAKLKKFKLPGSDKILAEMFQAGGEILLYVIHKLINSVWNKEELPDQWKESSIIVPVEYKCQYL